MSEETTTEQLAEIEGQAEDTPATEYTPPEGWRVVRFGEQLLPGDVWVNEDGTERRSAILHWDAAAVSGGRCIRRIKPQPQPQPEPNTAAIEELRSEVSYVQNLLGAERRRVTELEELVASLRTINEAQEKAVEAAGKENTALRLQVQNRQQEYERQKGRIEFLETLNAGNGAAIADYIAKVAKLQGLVDTARGQLETAATEHDSLSTQLAAVKVELTSVAADRQRLQIELDAAQQVPPAIADRFKEGWNQGTARAVETVLEWLVPIRTCGSQALATAVISNLPHIMRSLTGLEDEGIE